MWQPPLNKHFQEVSASNVNNTQQNELAANLLHTQKLLLTDLLPPLTAAATSVPQSVYNSVAASSLLQNIPTISVRPPSTTLVNNLQQYLKQRVGKSFAMSPSAQWPSAINHSDNRNLLLSSPSLLAADAVAPISPPSDVLPATFLTPPPVASLPFEPKIAAGATVLNMLPLDILTETFSRLNALHLTNPSLAQTFTQLVAATSALDPANTSTTLHSNRYFSANRPTLPHIADSSTLSPLSASLPANKNLTTPHHLNLLKQYLSMEQQQLQQHLLALKGVSTARVNACSTSPSASRINDFYSSSVNLNPITASSSNTSKSTYCSSNTFICDKQQHQRSLRKRRDDLSDLFNKKSNSSPVTEREPDDSLPPPKKKWIRHYLKEDNSQNNDASNININNNNTSFMLLTNSKTTKLIKTSTPPSSPIPMVIDDEPEPDDALMKTKADVEKVADCGSTMATFTLIGRNGEIIGNANTSKQMLLANGIRIAAPTVSIGSGQQQSQAQQLALSKAVNIPFNNKNIPIITGFPYQFTSTTKTTTPTSSTNVGASSSNSVVLTSRNKTFIPLTPPPMSSRKFVEPTQSRIRSFSLSSHKFSANNHHQMHVQNGNNSNNNSMMVDEVPPTQQHHSSSSQHSPPRHVSSSLGTTAGSHYMHMINTASSQQVGLAGSGANHVTHATPRRRTISSTSNGAGTREVHNKLEKNRRAHLKECYEALKNQLSLKDEDRRKTSNLAILGEALKCVQSFQKRNQDLEAEWEHLANDKINLQKRIVSLKRELGPKYEQIFSGIFPDIEVGSIPSERESINETHSFSSGRGSALYSSSSSLSSGGSNGSSNSGGGSASNTLPSPVGAGLQTAMPTTVTPVINKINNSNINSTSPILINSNSNVVIQQQQHQRKNPLITTTIQAVTIPTQGGGGGGGVSSPPAGSPTALVTFGNSLPLSLTAKNISATAVTRGSPTPSTPSPSPSSSSGVSSSSSLISSSPPINGVINNGRNVTVNIPNCLKLQAAAVAGSGLNGSGNIIASSGTTTSTAATILATSAPAQGVSNTNNVLGNQQQHNGRKKNLTSSNNNNTNFNSNTNNVVDQHQQLQQQQQHVSEDGEQPAKFLKVFNSSPTAATNGHHHHPQQQQQQQHHNQNDFQTHGQKLLLTSNGGILSGGGCGNGNNNTMNKSMTNGSTSYATTPATLASTSELCRLPGGAELNILPSNGLKISSNNAASVATAFYHANGKITFINGPPVHHPHQYQYQHPPSSPLPNSTTITSNGTTTLTNGILLKDATSVTPLLVSAASSPPTSSVNGLHFAGNFAQLLAAANTTATANNASHGSNGATNATASIVPMATNFQRIAESKGKNNNKGSIASWRSGAATTN